MAQSAPPYQLPPNNLPGVIRLSDNAFIPDEPDNRDWVAYQQWVSGGGVPAPAAAPATNDLYNAKKAAGITIRSSKLSAVNATYAVDENASIVISGIYAGIKGGDGLPGGGLTFNYPDVNGVNHAFDAVTFSAFAKAVRDYRYQLIQASQQTNPVWPNATVTLP